MKPDDTTLKAAFRKRELELEKIIQQMKDDDLHTGTVYRNLEQELKVVKTKLSSVPTQGKD